MPLFWYRVNANGIQFSANSEESYARSARAYLRSDPGGLGMASAYAVFLQRAKECGTYEVRAAGGTRGLYRHIWRAMRMARKPSLRMQFINAWRHQGFMQAINRALVKVNRQ